MTDTIWLILASSGVVACRKSEPPASALKPHQRAVRLTVSVSDQVFRRAPIPAAMLDIPEEALRRPAVFEMDAVVDTPPLPERPPERPPESQPEPVRGAADVENDVETVESTPAEVSSPAH